MPDPKKTEQWLGKKHLKSTNKTRLTVAPVTEEALRGAWHAYALKNTPKPRSTARLTLGHMQCLAPS